MAKFEHLTKERELELGWIIQNHYKALEELKQSNLTVKTRKKLENEVAVGKAAVEELVSANLGLVYDRARIFKSKYPGASDFDDLVSMGKIGLMVAVEKYDPSRGNKFSTVAFYWIAQSMGREVNKTNRLVRLPENRIADYTRMNKVASEFEEEGISNAELDEKIMDRLNLSKTDLLNIRNAAAAHSSLNRKIGGSADDSSKELIDLVGEEKAVLGTEVSVINDACYHILKDAIKDLEEEKQVIIAAQFSLPIEGASLATPQEVRDHYGLTSSRYRRLLAEGLSEIRTVLSGNDLNLSDFLEI